MSIREEIQITDLEPSLEGGDDVQYVVQIRGIDATGRPGPWSSELVFTSPQQIAFLQSNNYVPGESGFSLDNDGNVEINGATFRGLLESANYVPGSTGWRLAPNGFAEFGTGVFRGALQIGQNTFNVDSGGNMYIGGSTLNTSPFAVDTNGNVLAMSLDAEFITTGTLGANVIYAGSIVASQIDSGTLDPVRIPNLSADKITSGFLSANRIQVGSIGGNKLADGAVDTVQLAAEAVDRFRIANGEVIREKVALLAINSARIDDLDVGKLTGIEISGFNGSFLTLNALTINATLSNMTAPGFSVNSSNSFYGNTCRVDSYIVYEGPTSVTSTSGTVTLRRRSSDGRLVIFTSSRKFKKDIETAPVYSIDDIRPVLYRGNQEDDDYLQYGLIAEELAELNIPGLVSYDNNNEPIAVNYSMIGLLLVDHIKSLSERIKKLEDNHAK